MIQLISLKGTWSVHSFNGDYLSIPEGTGSSCGYLFHEIPGICFQPCLGKEMLIRKIKFEFNLIIQYRKIVMQGVLCIQDLSSALPLG